jgi:hypothetical protein
MKIVILITVIESSAVMLAILYFYYRRSQSGKRAFSTSKLKTKCAALSFREQTVKARALNQKSRPDKALDSIHSPLKADIKI